MILLPTKHRTDYRRPRVDVRRPVRRFRTDRLRRRFVPMLGSYPGTPIVIPLPENCFDCFCTATPCQDLLDAVAARTEDGTYPDGVVWFTFTTDSCTTNVVDGYTVPLEFDPINGWFIFTGQLGTCSVTFPFTDYIIKLYCDVGTLKLSLNASGVSLIFSVGSATSPLVIVSENPLYLTFADGTSGSAAYCVSPPSDCENDSVTGILGTVEEL